MRILMAIVIVSLAVRAAAQSPGPITTNPLPAPIEKRGLTVEIKDLVRLPDTRGMRPADQDGAPTSRADLNISRSSDGELLISSRQDGMIRMLVPDAPVTSPSPRQ